MRILRQGNDLPGGPADVTSCRWGRGLLKTALSASEPRQTAPQLGRRRRRVAEDPKSDDPSRQSSPHGSPVPARPPRGSAARQHGLLLGHRRPRRQRRTLRPHPRRPRLVAPQVTDADHHPPPPPAGTTGSSTYITSVHPFVPQGVPVQGVPVGGGVRSPRRPGELTISLSRRTVRRHSIARNTCVICVCVVW